MAEPVTLHIAVQIPDGIRIDAAVLLALEAAAEAMRPHGANAHQIARAARWLAESYEQKDPSNV